MANNGNLRPAKKGEIRNPKGRTPGVPNRANILQFLLFEADIDEMGIVKNKPDWYDKVKPKNLYQVMTLAMASKAMSGDSKAFAALNKAMGDKLLIEGDINVALVEYVGNDADNNEDSDTDSDTVS